MVNRKKSDEDKDKSGYGQSGTSESTTSTNTDRSYATQIQRSEDSVSTGWEPSGVWKPAGVRDSSQDSQQASTSAGALDTDQNYGEEYHIQRALKNTGTAEDEVPDQVTDVLKSGGMPLPPAIQRELESKMDGNFSNVRVHTGPSAAEAADAIDARAFTCGNDIVFNDGEYDPRSPEGKHLLAHELAHVKQQNGGAPISMMPKPDAELEIDPDTGLEREAEETAQQVIEGDELSSSLGRTAVHIQRNHEHQTRYSDGTFGPLKDEYAAKRTEREDKVYDHDNRPSYAAGQRDEVWEKGKNQFGVVICPEKDVVLDEDNWVMGHKPGREYWHLAEYYLRGIISREVFLTEFKNPDHYRPESVEASSSGEHELNGEYWESKWGPLE